MYNIEEKQGFPFFKKGYRKPVLAGEIIVINIREKRYM